MNSQPDSKLFTIALELRQAIYSHQLPNGIHVSTSHGRIVLSVCVQPSPEGSFVGDERRVFDDSESPKHRQKLFYQRLKSSWGPHWACEEAALAILHESENMGNSQLAPFHVCKQA